MEIESMTCSKTDTKMKKPKRVII